MNHFADTTYFQQKSRYIFLVAMKKRSQSTAFRARIVTRWKEKRDKSKACLCLRRRPLLRNSHWNPDMAAPQWNEKAVKVIKAMFANHLRAWRSLNNEVANRWKLLPDIYIITLWRSNDHEVTYIHGHNETAIRHLGYFVAYLKVYDTQEKWYITSFNRFVIWSVKCNMQILLFNLIWFNISIYLSIYI